MKTSSVPHRLQTQPFPICFIFGGFIYANQHRKLFFFRFKIQIFSSSESGHLLLTPSICVSKIEPEASPISKEFTSKSNSSSSSKHLISLLGMQIYSGLLLKKNFKPCSIRLGFDVCVFFSLPRSQPNEPRKCRCREISAKCEIHLVRRCSLGRRRRRRHRHHRRRRSAAAIKIQHRSLKSNHVEEVRFLICVPAATILMPGKRGSNGSRSLWLLADPHERISLKTEMGSLAVKWVNLCALCQSLKEDKQAHY